MAVAGAAGGRITAGAGANLLGIHAADRNQDATCYVGNIDVQATEELIWELFVQAGPVGVYLCMYAILPSPWCFVLNGNCKLSAQITIIVFSITNVLRRVLQ
jgi:hypothetical protein